MGYDIHVLAGRRQCGGCSRSRGRRPEAPLHVRGSLPSNGAGSCPGWGPTRCWRLTPSSVCCWPSSQWGPRGSTGTPARTRTSPFGSYVIASTYYQRQFSKTNTVLKFTTKKWRRVKEEKKNYIQLQWSRYVRTRKTKKQKSNLLESILLVVKLFQKSLHSSMSPKTSKQFLLCRSPNYKNPLVFIFDTPLQS